jgi:hypothetical protein
MTTYVIKIYTLKTITFFSFKKYKVILLEFSILMNFLIQA